MRSMNEQSLRELMQVEDRALQALSTHKSIVKYYGFVPEAQYYKSNGKQQRVAYLIFELLPNGDMFDQVSECGPFKERLTRYLGR